MVVTEELARRLERVGVLTNVEWFERVLAAGNPLGIHLERFGEAWAVATPSRPDLDFLNRVGGLFTEDADRVGEIVDFYRALGIRPWFELLPGQGFERLAALLADAGAGQVDFHTLLFGPARTAGRAARGVAVRELGEGELELFGEIWRGGNGVPDSDAPLVAGWRRFRLYLAEVDGHPAGGAVLRLGDGVGYLANAATLPELRGRGVQSALILRRIEDAAAAGCELVASQAAFGSPSQRNLERAGLRIACTKAVWRMLR